MQNDHDIRAYFLQQGQSIARVYDILNSSILTGYVKRGLSVFFEILLVLVFFALLVICAMIPLDPVQFTQEISESTSVTETFHNEDLMYFMVGLKLFMFLVSLLPLVLMFLLRRNRKKSELIHNAFTEIEVMKGRFEQAVKTLNI